MLAALAGVVHDRQRADGHEHTRARGALPAESIAKIGIRTHDSLRQVKQNALHRWISTEHGGECSFKRLIEKR
jgi:hypothetical protein